MNRLRFSFAPALVLLAVWADTPLRAADMLSELPAEHQARIRKGEQVLLSEEVEGKPWPRVKIYRTVAATPEEVAAVFCDYEYAKAYVPNVLKSTVSSRPSANTAEIDYGLDVPILPDEFYTTRNTVKRTGPDVYRIDWKLLRAVQTKDSVGSLRAEPFDGKTLICYENLVTPGSSMAGLLKGVAVKQMGQTVEAIAGRVEKQKTTNARHLESEVEALRKMLQQETP